MEKKMKQLYQAPELTVVAFQAERGYSVSNTGFLGLVNEGTEGNENLEARTDNGATWGDGRWF